VPEARLSPASARLAAALAGAILGLAGSPGSPLGAVPEPIKVRAGAHEGYARLVLEWSAPVAIGSRQQGGRLTLRFARPFAADFSLVLNAIGEYLTGLEHDAGGRQVLLRLAPEVSASLEINDRRVVIIDLRHRIDASSTVAVRTGIRDNPLRIGLDWSEPIDFVAEAEGRLLRVRFERAADIDAAMIAERCQTVLERASASVDGSQTELRLILKTGVRAQVSKVGDRQVAIDLHEPPRAPPDPAEPPVVSAHAPHTAQAMALEAELQRPAPPNFASGPARSLTTLPAKAGPPKPVASPKPESSGLALEITAAEIADGMALDFVWSRPTAAAVLLRAGYLWSIFATSAAASDVPLPSLASVAPGWLGPGEQVNAAGGTALRFPLRRPLAARVERAGTRWRVVLGATAAPPEAARLERLADPPRLRIVSGEAAHLVRLTDPEVGDRLEVWPLLSPGLGQPRPQRLVDLELLETVQGLAWRPLADELHAGGVDGAVELLAQGGLRLSADSPMSAPPPARVGEPPAQPAAELSGGSPAGLGDQPQPAVSPTPFRPELLTTTPAKTPSSRADHVMSPRASVPTEFASERSAGRAAEQRAALGATEPARAPDAPAAPSSSVSSPLGLARFAPASPSSILERRTYWQQRVVNASARDRPSARLDLARFFLAQALGAEALAVVEVAKPEATPLEPALELARRTITGAAQLLMDRPDEAATGLEAPALDADPEAALWRAVLAGARADWPRAARELARSGATLDEYPAPLQLRLGLPVARIAIEAGDQDEAARRLGRLQALELGPVERDRVAFIAGLAKARRGALDEADEIWHRLERSEDRQTRIAAGFARVQMLLHAGRLSPAEALARLAAARPLWRPHPEEPAMLDGLARAYLQNHEPSAALYIWREVLSRFPGTPDAARIAKAMRDSFVASLLPADGTGIGPIRAFALYRDFPELVPDGALGERLRRSLAAQLAGLDLIEPAASLLGPSLEDLEMPTKAETGAWLAELWLRAPNPAAALAALDRTETAGDLAEALSRQRRLLRARALAASDRQESALALLEGGADPAERRLRAGILWDQHDWPRLIGALEPLLPAGAGPRGPLAEPEQELVIRLAVAYAHQGEARALEELRRRLGEAMHGQASEPAFLMATLPSLRAPGLVPALAAADEELGRVRAYLQTILPAR
jgi:hypothetical protein